MTLEELEAAFTAQKTVIENLTNQLNTLVNSVQQIANQPSPTPTPAPTPSPTLTPDPTPTTDTSSSVQIDALSTQIKTLQDQIEAEKKAAFVSKLNADLATRIATRGLRTPNVLQRHLLALWSDKAVEENGQFFWKDGAIAKTFDQMLDDFVKTDEGKEFVPAKRPTGTGVTVTGSGNTPPTPEAPKAKTALEQLELDYKASLAANANN